MNGVGWSNVFSTILSVTTCTVPTAMTTLSAGAVYPMSITLSWPSLTTGTGGDASIYYQVSWYDPNATAWTVMTTLSVGL